MARLPVPRLRWCANLPSRAFRLDIRKLRDKAIQAGVIPAKHQRQTTSQSETATFQEISLNSMFMTSVLATGLILERPDGMRVRIEGQLPDPEYVGRLVACFVMR